MSWRGGRERERKGGEGEGERGKTRKTRKRRKRTGGHFPLPPLKFLFVCINCKIRGPPPPSKKGAGKNRRKTTGEQRDDEGQRGGRAGGKKGSKKVDTKKKKHSSSSFSSSSLLPSFILRPQKKHFAPRSSLPPPFHAFQPWPLLSSLPVSRQCLVWSRGVAEGDGRGRAARALMRCRPRVVSITHLLPLSRARNPCLSSPSHYGDALEHPLDAIPCVCGAAPRDVRGRSCAQGFCVDGETHARFVFAPLELDDNSRRYRRAAGSLQSHGRPGEAQDWDQR